MEKKTEEQRKEENRGEESRREENKREENRGEEILEVSHVTNRYRDSGTGLFSRSKMTRVLNDVSLTIHRDEIFGLVGESGCGKSTLGRAVLGLIPFEGQIRVGGMERSGRNRKEFTRCVQAVFQDPLSSLNPRRTIAQTLEEPLLTHGIGTKETRRQKALEMLETVGLDASYADRLPRELSGGQRQRVCIGAALMIDPELVIADEATSALDVSVGAQILNLFQEIHDRKEFAMLFISHNLNVVYYLCERIAVMYRGSIVEQGDADSLYNYPRHPYTRMLLSAIPEIEEADALGRYGFKETRREPAPDGCDFYHRCPYASEACRKKPQLIDVTDEAQPAGNTPGGIPREHLVRCWNPVRDL